MKEEHGPRITLFECEKCKKVFTKKIYMRRHIRKYHEEIKNKVKCEKCDKLYSDKSIMRLHNITFHEGKKKNIDVTVVTRFMVTNIT